jgi:branched-chain amino acid aminotransferase
MHLFRVLRLSALDVDGGKMINERVVWIDHEWVPWDKANIHLFSYSMGRGATVFEVMSVYNSAGGSAIFRLDKHIQRLYRSVDMLGMQLPLAPEELELAIINTVRKNQIQVGTIKVICYHPEISLSLQPPKQELHVSIFAIDPNVDLPKSADSEDSSTTLTVSKWRKLDPQNVPIEAKAAANYLNGMVACIDAVKRGFKQAVMLDTQGFIAEGGTESIFMVKDSVLFTPALGTVLHGITRMSTLQLARSLEIPTAEARVGPEIYLDADEIFLTNSVNRLLPVRQIEDCLLEPIPGPVTTQLAEAFAEVVSGRNKHFVEWLTFV